MSNNTHSRNQARRGLTLIELLTAIAVVGVLSSMAFAVSVKVKDYAAKTNECATARQLVSTFLLYPNDNNGTFMRGSGEEPKGELKGFGGATISADKEEAMRWPWKLANLMTDGASGLFTSEHQDYYQYLQSRHDNYNLSLTPSMAMNLVFVGGNYRSSTLAPDAKTQGRGNRKAIYAYDYCVTRPDIAYKPSDIIVFVSAFSDYAEGWEDVGFYSAVPPISPDGMRWGSYTESIPSSMGHVHLRHNNEAVVAMLDGSVRMMGEDELRDMRHWSNQAIIANDPNFADFKQN
ncbi:prepilin-type N-terminal cleavage/methylation domain-containing protein [Ruficoccus amylovorans]|uniref:Prepilin-type N-terminal cleavage/methylation domain-containing protein n=1 Tax=Ruficoccus amylovorans TaxID=1804625 RepID=A0A842HGV1_9BACT|nr:prepilin-type N-terminal cleavage/methylation domain-containing protein [Ruficoccus amylovorans]MBC2595753.1 prepilin-type N-terminal cleavage/methylation domain-containing protein [Ruficoccus amylovorans]